MPRQRIEQLADEILSLDEADLSVILSHYKKRMENFQPTPDWERSVIAFFIINAVRVKNNLLKGYIHQQNFSQCNHDCPCRTPRLRVVK
ncbi:MAG: hypothetical protein JRI57_08515 [Deltaproteobacteria bacterium]|nr:hypothetical protein [Deltaproteobacteria bacterium]MBW1952817.1 hypothetical protein [Deltaproteobacteria bacterium]MBW1987311.1 hypothetical protein [Deltaproteobacteria bacterium]MBW2135426.1 hypothetical protein [Deltaproteobacteria bacterium]